MNFEKILIAGKDYIYIPDERVLNSLSEKDIRQLCDRRTGIGGDGIFSFTKKSLKTQQIKAFTQNGELQRDISSIEICAIFSTFSKTKTTKHESEDIFSEKIHFFGEENSQESAFSREFDYNDTDNYILKKTEIGNRIITLTRILLHGTHTVHFSGCIDSFDIDYFGKHISGNSLFDKKADITIAQNIFDNTFLMKYYENRTGNPYPTVSVFAAVALAACKTGQARYGEEIHLICNKTDVYAFCDKNNSCMIQGNIKRTITGKI